VKWPWKEVNITRTKALLLSLSLHLSTISGEIDYMPKLAADGSNWATYRDRMSWVLGGDLADHLTNAEVPKSRAGAETVTTTRWERDDAIVQQYIAASIPDDVFAVVQKGTSAKDFWHNLEARFEIKSRRISPGSSPCGTSCLGRGVSSPTLTFPTSSSTPSLTHTTPLLAVSKLQRFSPRRNGISPPMLSTCSLLASMRKIFPEV
jgi:hypothetical protein